MKLLDHIGGVRRGLRRQLWGMPIYKSAGSGLCWVKEFRYKRHCRTEEGQLIGKTNFWWKVMIVVPFRGILRDKGLSHLLLIMFFVSFWVLFSWVCAYKKIYWLYPYGLCTLLDVSCTSVERREVVLKEETWTLFLVSWRERERGEATDNGWMERAT